MRTTLDLLVSQSRASCSKILARQKCSGEFSNECMFQCSGESGVSRSQPSARWRRYKQAARRNERRPLSSAAPGSRNHCATLLQKMKKLRETIGCSACGVSYKHVKEASPEFWRITILLAPRTLQPLCLQRLCIADIYLGARSGSLEDSQSSGKRRVLFLASKLLHVASILKVPQVIRTWPIVKLV